MPERVSALWVWIRVHWRGSVAVAVALVMASVGTAFIISQLPPPGGQDCGQIAYELLERDPAARAASQQVLSCFWQHYQRCQPATVHLTYGGVDSSAESTMIVERQRSGCDVYVSRTETVNANGSHRTYRCASMQVQGERYHLSACGHQQPSFDLRPITLNFGTCGYIGRADLTPSPAEAEHCFATAYSLCARATLVYVTAQDVKTFTVQEQCTIVYTHHQSQTACVGEALRQDGLHFFRCGRDGEIVVPATPQPTPSAPGRSATGALVHMLKGGLTPCDPAEAGAGESGDVGPRPVFSRDVCPCDVAPACVLLLTRRLV